MTTLSTVTGATPKATSRMLLAYGGTLAVALLALSSIQRLGSRLEPSSELGAVKAVAAAAGAHAAGTAGSTLLHVLLSLLVVIIASRVLGAIFHYLQQPAVIGEVIAGILLGPSLLGRAAPEVFSYVFPATVIPLLGVLAQVGVIMFMFLVGLELDTTVLKRRANSALAISHASIVAPLLLGALLSLWLYPHAAPRHVPFLVFALFMGVAMSITAFPVLARILRDRGMHKSQLGVLALSCAAIDDATAWCLLALVVGIAQAKAGAALLTTAMTLGYVGFIYLVARPFVHRVVRAQELKHKVGRGPVALVLVGALLSALITEAIGIHAIFGAFLVGGLIPHDSRLAHATRERLEDLVLVLLLPAFFAFTGLRTEFGLLSSGSAWLMCGAIVLVACIGKVGGTYVAARLTGLTSRDALSLGFLMNTRGLVELVVLNIGLDLGVITPSLFAMMVLMAVVTTFATAPLVALVSKGAPARAAALT